MPEFVEQIIAVGFVLVIIWGIYLHITGRSEGTESNAMAAYEDTKFTTKPRLKALASRFKDFSVTPE